MPKVSRTEIINAANSTRHRPASPRRTGSARPSPEGSWKASHQTLATRTNAHATKPTL